ncbi:MAG: hypothetical protein ACKERG_03785 [Candidatus Hodgkinia cicadicola]
MAAVASNLLTRCERSVPNWTHNPAILLDNKQTPAANLEHVGNAIPQHSGGSVQPPQVTNYNQLSFQTHNRNVSTKPPPQFQLRIKMVLAGCEYE